MEEAGYYDCLQPPQVEPNPEPTGTFPVECDFPEEEGGEASTEEGGEAIEEGGKPSVKRWK